MKVSMGPFKAFMKQNNLTHNDVAMATGLSKGTIDAFMQKRFSYGTLRKICQAYRIQLNDIIEMCHDQFEDNSIELDESLNSKLQTVFMLCEAKRKDYLKSHDGTASVAEIYRDAFLDCLDLCYEYLK